MTEDRNLPNCYRPIGTNFYGPELIFKDKCFSKNMKGIKTAKIAQQHRPKLFGTKNDNLQPALQFFFSKIRLQ